MTTMIDRPVAPVVPPVAPGRALLALARAEGVRLLRHPLFVAAVLLIVGPLVYWHVQGDETYRYPVLQEADQALQLGVGLLLGGATLMVANLAVLRARRHGLTESFGVLPLGTVWRVAAHLLSVLPAVGVATLIVVGQIAVLAANPYSVGRPDPFQLVTGPAVVMLMGALGILLARLIASAVVAPVVLLLLVAPQFFLSRTASRFDVWALHPFQFGSYTDASMPSDLMLNRPGAHMLYLVGLAVVLGAVAVLRGGARRAPTVAVLAVAVLLASVAGVVQMQPPGRSALAKATRANEHPATMQTCRRLDRTTYCTFAEYKPWVPLWHRTVGDVIRNMPPEFASTEFAVRQYVMVVKRSTRGSTWASSIEPDPAFAADDRAAGFRIVAPVGSLWNDAEELALAANVAFHLVRGDLPAAHGQLCDARGVLTVWLAGAANPRTRAALTRLRRNSWGGLRFGESLPFGGASVPDQAANQGIELLKRPTGEVAAAVRSNWAELTAPGTTPQRAAEILGVPAVPVPPENQGVCQ